MQKPIFEIKEIQNKSIEKDILKAQKDLSKFFGLSFSLPRVFIIKDQRQMNILYQRILDRNSVGSCDGDNIFISSQLLKDDYDRFQKILVHEYAHMAIREFCDILKVKPA